ncbi:MAG: ABC transporter ATP-binding protein [Gammaproteobacteria bacterium]|nr:ABC transporter ATP-binding protein [Gammaproteobacteria bacterium]
MSLLSINNLTVDFMTHRGSVRAVDGIHFEIEKGELLGIVGESGSGKSVTALAILNLLPDNARVEAKEMRFMERDLLTQKTLERSSWLGKDLSMIFQDPVGSLNPCFTIGSQLEEAIQIHRALSPKAVRLEAISLLQSVGLPEPHLQLKAYPHQLSGGMNQRVMIAIAIAHHPSLLIADEPTTALDVTIQAQILDLLLQLNRRYHMSILLVSHDFGVISETCDRILVMRHGKIVEQGETATLLKSPEHPYTQMLLSCCERRGK